MAVAFRFQQMSRRDLGRGEEKARAPLFRLRSSLIGEVALWRREICTAAAPALAGAVVNAAFYTFVVPTLAAVAAAIAVVGKTEVAIPAAAAAVVLQRAVERKAQQRRRHFRYRQRARNEERGHAAASVRSRFP